MARHKRRGRLSEGNVQAVGGVGDVRETERVAEREGEREGEREAESGRIRDDGLRRHSSGGHNSGRHGMEGLRQAPRNVSILLWSARQDLFFCAASIGTPPTECPPADVPGSLLRALRRHAGVPRRGDAPMALPAAPDRRPPNGDRLGPKSSFDRYRREHRGPLPGTRRLGAEEAITGEPRGRGPKPAGADRSPATPVSSPLGGVRPSRPVAAKAPSGAAGTRFEPRPRAREPAPRARGSGGVRRPSPRRRSGSPSPDRPRLNVETANEAVTVP